MTEHPHLGWNVVDDIVRMFDFPFMVNAFRAGTIVAVTAGVVGWFMVLRRQAFAGHTLALVGFPGAAGAVLIGVSPQVGFFAACAAGGLALGLLSRHGSPGSEGDAATVAVVQAFSLALGALFLARYGGNLSSTTALLFGTLFGVTSADVLRLAVTGLVAVLAVLAIGRRLLFASVDPDVAAARGVPVRGLSVAFALVLGGAAASATQLTGSLLVFALLVIPAATAQSLTPSPAAGLAVSVGMAVGVTWLSLAAAYYSPYPVGFWLTSFAFGAFVAVRLARLSARSTMKQRFV